MMKKFILSLALALTFIGSFIPTAFAAETKTVTEDIHSNKWVANVEKGTLELQKVGQVDFTVTNVISQSVSTGGARTITCEKSTKISPLGTRNDIIFSGSGTYFWKKINGEWKKYDVAATIDGNGGAFYELKESGEYELDFNFVDSNNNEYFALVYITIKDSAAPTTTTATTKAPAATTTVAPTTTKAAVTAKAATTTAAKAIEPTAETTAAAPNPSTGNTPIAPLAVCVGVLAMAIYVKHKK